MDAPSLRETLAAAIARLRVRDPAEARADATRLLAHAVGRDAAWLLAHDDDALDPVAAVRFAAALERRARGEPVAYILGSAGFFGRTFAVDASVLVPRPETEAVVEAALAAVRTESAPTFCDVGTGSGAIALSLACERPDARVTAIDVSAAALATARRNARDLGVADRVRFVRGAGLAALPPGERFACVVANLPYVPTGDLAAAPDPTTFEPRTALDGGRDGLDQYRPLVRDAPARLEAPGSLILEAGPGTAEPLAGLVRAAFPGRRVEIRADYAGHARLVLVV